MRTFLLFLIAVNALPVFADDLTIKNGTVYSDYSIYKVSEKGLSISHKNGISTIPFEDIPDEIQKKYAEQYYAAKKKDELAKKKENEERSLLDISCDNNPRELIYMKVADFRNGVIALEYFPERHVVTMRREIRIIPAKYGKNVFISSLNATKKGKGETLSLSEYNKGIFWRIGAININGNSYACYTIEKEEALNYLKGYLKTKK